jgi:hypothetical protein
MIYEELSGRYAKGSGCVLMYSTILAFGGYEKTHEDPKSRHLVSGVRFEPGVFRERRRRPKHFTTANNKFDS